MISSSYADFRIAVFLLSDSGLPYSDKLLHNKKEADFTAKASVI